MDPREFGSLAKELIKAKKPAHSRSAISRAYYAAFHIARNYLEENGFTVARNDSSHALVQRWLSWGNDDDLSAAASKLDSMRGIRNKADYDVHLPEWDSDKTAAVWVLNAANCIEAFDAAFKGDKKAAIVDAIRASKAKVG